MSKQRTCSRCGVQGPKCNCQYGYTSSKSHEPSFSSKLRAGFKAVEHDDEDNKKPRRKDPKETDQDWVRAGFQIR